jgi:hypothetical protein
MNSLEKQRRMELRRVNGTRTARKRMPHSKTSGTASYLIAHACFDCRVSMKRVPQTVGSLRCPSCGGCSYEMGRSFRAPKRTDQEQWHKVRLLFAYGFRFFSYRSYPKAPRLPERLRDVRAFLRANPKHPFRVGPIQMNLLDCRRRRAV